VIQHQGDQIPLIGRRMPTLSLGEGLPAGVHCSKTTTIYSAISTIPVFSLTGACSIAFGTTYSPLQIASLALSLLFHRTAKTRVNSYEAKLTKWKMIYHREGFGLIDLSSGWSWWTTFWIEESRRSLLSRPESIAVENGPFGARVRGLH